MLPTDILHFMILNNPFSEELKHGCSEIWSKILNHRFIFEIQQDILPLNKFIFYLKQDQIFLNEFCELLIAVAKIANTKEEIELFENIINSTTIFEIKMQEEIMDSLGIGTKSYPEYVQNTTTSNYISYLKSAKETNDLGIFVSAIAPCPWTYFEIANKLTKVAVKTPVYKKWIEFYSSKESQKQVSEIKSLLNRLAMQTDNQKKFTLKKNFTTACNYELDFWNMAYFDGD
jgi:thiaminase (transcriptional activator TenA)